MNPITPWATTPTYPAGANSWSGKPTKIPPSVTYMTPEQPQGLSAQNLNWQFNSFASIAGAVAVGQWMTAVANWNEPVPNIGAPSLPAVTPVTACWDAFGQQWIVAGGAGAIAQAILNFSYDGKTWVPIAGAIPTPTTRPIGFAVATNPTTGDLPLFRSDGFTCSVTLWSGGVGTPTDTVQPFLAGCDQGILSYFNGGWQFVGTSDLIRQPNWTGFAATSANAVGTWTNATTSLPLAWQSGTSNSLLQLISAQSPTTLAVAMCGLTPGTSTSRLMAMTTASGWSDMTPALPGPSGQQYRGLCFAPNDQLWGLLTQDPSGNSYLYTSPDLSTWTLVQTLTGFWAGGVAAIGSVWALLVYNAAAAEGGNRVLYSGNVASLGAACTWNFAGYTEDVTGQGAELPFSPSGLFLSNAGAQGGAIAGGIASAPNAIGSQLLRCETLRNVTNGGGTVAASDIAGYSGFFPTTSPSGAAGGGVPQQIRIAINFSAGTFESVTVIPAGAVVTRVTLDVRTAFSGGTPTFEVGYAGSAGYLIPTGVLDSDLGTVDVYNQLLDSDWTAANEVLVTIGGAPTAGAGFVLVEFSQPLG
jgi:hypothetical protein